MTDGFDAIEFARYLGSRWKWIAGSAVGAVVLTLAVCAILTPVYTATATLVIEAPPGLSPGASTAVSAVYLESLRTYEEYANSDTLFAKAVAKFGLSSSGAPIEALKRRVLKVSKPKDTKVLTVRVTLPDPKQAQAVAQHLAEETVQLNRAIAQSAESDQRADVARQLKQYRDELDKARQMQKEADASGERVLEAELHDLEELRFRTSEQLISARALAAEQNGTDGTSTRARIAVLEREKANLDREAAAKQAAMASYHSRMVRAEDSAREALDRVESASRRVNDLSAATGRAEQLRVIDPGVVPQEPSFPKPSLYGAGAFAIALMLSLAYLTLRFGMARGKGVVRETELRVARGNR